MEDIPQRDAAELRRLPVEERDRPVVVDEEIPCAGVAVLEHHRERRRASLDRSDLLVENRSVARSDVVQPEEALEDVAKMRGELGPGARRWRRGRRTEVDEPRERASGVGAVGRCSRLRGERGAGDRRKPEHRAAALDAREDDARDRRRRDDADGTEVFQCFTLDVEAPVQIRIPRRLDDDPRHIRSVLEEEERDLVRPVAAGSRHRPVEATDVDAGLGGDASQVGGRSRRADDEPALRKRAKPWTGDLTGPSERADHHGTRPQSPPLERAASVGRRFRHRDGDLTERRSKREPRRVLQAVIAPDRAGLLHDEYPVLREPLRRGRDRWAALRTGDHDQIEGSFGDRPDVDLRRGPGEDAASAACIAPGPAADREGACRSGQGHQHGPARDPEDQGLAGLLGREQGQPRRTRGGGRAVAAGDEGSRARRVQHHFPCPPIIIRTSR